MKQVDEVELTRVIDQIIAANPQPVAEYKKGKTGIIMFFVGQVKRELKGRGDAVSIRKILQEQLK
ncbi:MAG: Aspartyl/glutamyl-tRNA(Asn/Gln) amidotransferase subunit B [Candidatus Gottesmanbacteria bacterium GW2011_GWA1_42_26]|nr:MAG: Aspartyl/glutamyl-tRNA(Asn/Gln) amidotransferase subunit B [Candidatus Gottesmanbacteria bacterium GW2011_GWA1_42_26]